MSTALRCAGLGHRYGRKIWGLRDCSLDVPAGRVVALVGPNGSGKTTLMSMAAGLLPASTGRVEAAGGAPAQRLDKIGFVAQDAPLWPRLRVAEVALTLVLAKKPELFLLDEPMANLDPLARREFLGSMFEACSETGATVLYSSHAVAELERICDYLIVLRAGHLRLAGDIDELRHQHRVICGPDGWPRSGGWQVISQRSMAGRTTALVRRDGAHLAGPGLHDAAPTFDELVLGYLEGETATLPEEALA